MTDEELTEIYKSANNVTAPGKYPPITTKFIFAAMRKCYELGLVEKEKQNEKDCS